MTQMTETMPVESSAGTDLVGEIHRVLAMSPEPLTLSKIKTQLSPPHRNISPEELTEVLQRQVAANVLHQYPKYRSQQDRYWDRPMPVHIRELLRAVLQEGSYPWSELRRKLPAYALPQAEGVLQDMLAQGQIHRHPPAGKRGGERFGVQPPDPKEYLRTELTAAFRRLAQLGFTQSQLREGALELLHEEEWSLTEEASPPQPEEEPQASVQGALSLQQPAERAADPSMPTEPSAPMPQAMPAPEGPQSW